MLDFIPHADESLVGDFFSRAIINPPGFAGARNDRQAYDAH
jgi:hypothetical protein